MTLYLGVAQHKTEDASEEGDTTIGALPTIKLMIERVL